MSSKGKEKEGMEMMEKKKVTLKDERPTLNGKDNANGKDGKANGKDGKDGKANGKDGKDGKKKNSTADGWEKELLKAEKGINRIPLRLRLAFELTLEIAAVALIVAVFFLWQTSFYQLSDINENWSTAPIVDIQLVNSRSDCPTNYEEISATFMTVNSFCDCGSGNIILTPCTSANQGCQNILPVDSFDLPLWKNFKVCAERHPSGSEVSALNRGEHCNQIGWKNCSTSGFDPICVPTGSSCPLTYFSIVDGGPSQCPTGTTAAPAFPGTLNPKYLCTNRTGNIPLVDISIVLGGNCVGLAPTFDPFVSTGASDSINLSTPPFPCGSSRFDNRYTNVDMRMMGTLFTDNIATLESNDVQQTAYWTTFPYPVYYKFQLRPEIYFNPNCSVSRQQVVGLLTKLSEITTLQTALAVVSLICCVFVSIPWLIWLCTPKGYKTYREKSTLFLLKTMFEILSQIAMVLLIGATFYVIRQVQPVLLVLTNTDCMDNYSISFFSDNYDTINSTSWMDAIVIIWAIVETFIQLLLMIVLPNPKKKVATTPKATAIEMNMPPKSSFNEKSDDQRLSKSSFSIDGVYSQYNPLTQAQDPVDDLGGRTTFEGKY